MLQEKSKLTQALTLWIYRVLIVICMGLALISFQRVEAAEETTVLKLREEIQAAAKHILKGEEISDWEAIGLLRSGNQVPSTYLHDLTALMKEQNGEFRKVTDYERYAIAIRAAGLNPASFSGFNLIQDIYNHPRMTNQGTNGPIFALIALDSGNYVVPADARWTRERLVEWLLKQQNSSGAFPLTEKGDDDVDMTAMAITALSTYKNQTKVKIAIDNAVKWLSSMQQANGGFHAANKQNSESASQVIIALTSIQYNPMDVAFIKKEHSLLSYLLKFRVEDGGFAHTLGQPSNEIATEQALMALAAYERYVQQKPSLYQVATDTSLADTSKRFVDHQHISSWAVDSVYRVFDAQVMVGVSGAELRFEPKKQMSRAELATMLVHLLGEQPLISVEPMFKDVNPEAWYYGAVMRAKQLGIIQGITTDLYKPSQAVTREQMAIMIAKAFGLKESAQPLPFNDMDQIQTSAKPYVNAVYTSGLMQGANDSFNPKVTVTREMAAVVASKLLVMRAS